MFGVVGVAAWTEFVSACQRKRVWLKPPTALQVAGTEQGVTEPTATFSACFGGAFLAWHPMKYAAMLAANMRAHAADAWLVNTGWSGGGYGVGSRMSLKCTRAIIDAIHSGELAAAEYARMPVFGLDVPVSISGVPDEILAPRATWPDVAAYDATLTKLAGLFQENMKQFADSAYVDSALVSEILAAGPAVESTAFQEPREAKAVLAATAEDSSREGSHRVSAVGRVNCAIAASASQPRLDQMVAKRGLA
jgi:Phosphoenolpyruvate carboxykinase